MDLYEYSFECLRLGLIYRELKKISVPPSASSLHVDLSEFHGITNFYPEMEELHCYLHKGISKFSTLHLGGGDLRPKLSAKVVPLVTLKGGR